MCHSVLIVGSLELVSFPGIWVKDYRALIRVLQKTEKTDLLLKTIGLFFVTALAEITGCFLPWLWLRKSGPAWLLIPAAASLALFVWLLTLHPAASGRVYAAYGGVYVVTALLWLRVVDGVTLSALDWTGAGIALLGMSIIVLGWQAKL